MSTITLEQRVEKIDERISSLESHNKQDEILDVLNKIKEKLIGSLENDAPGVVQDVKQLKENYKAIKDQLNVIDVHIQEIKKNQATRMNVDEEIKILKAEVDSLKRYRYYLAGGIVVVTWLLSRIGDVWGLLSK